MRRVILALVWAVFFSPPSVRAADDPLGDNAALQYWQAFAAMPQEHKLSEQEKKILENIQTAPLDETADAVLHKYENALEYLRRGAAMKSCSWGLAVDIKEDGPLGISQSYAAQGMRLARVACLRARQAFVKGQTRNAVEGLLDVFVLARHIGGDGTTFGKLLDDVIQKLAIDVAAANLGAIKDAKMLTTISARLTALPKSETVAQVLRREKDGMVAWIRAKRWAAVEILLDRDYADADKPKKELIRAFLGIDDGVYDKLCEAVGKQYDAAIAVTELPFAQYDEAAKAYKKNLKAYDLTVEPRVAVILPRLFAPSVTDRVQEVRAAARLAMFRAALEIMVGGKERLKGFKDPFDGGSFEYREVDGGFELKSKVPDGKGCFVTLLVRTSLGK
jgi:hypothetical protein